MNYKIKNMFHYVLIMLLMSGFQVLGQSAAVDMEAVDQFIEQSLRYHSAPGISVSITTADGTFYNRNHGTHLGKELNSATPLFIGSVSKVITALGIAVLHDRGALHFSDKASKYIPDTQLGDDSHITIRQLLHHHSGFSQQSGYDEKVEFEGQFSEAELSATPGEKGQYSSTNFAILGQVIEKVSGKPYKAFVENEIFVPLGMSNSYVPEVTEGKAKEGYTHFFGIPIKSRQMNYGYYIIPAGYIMSTTEDLNKMNLMLLNRGIVDDSITFLKPATVEAMFTPFKGNEFGYGKSWGIGKIAGVKAYSHEGLTSISNAFTAMLPDQGMAISVITNINSGPFYSLTDHIMEGIVKISQRQSVDNVFTWEMAIRIGLGFIMLHMLYTCIITLNRWKKNGYLRHLNYRAKYVISFIFGLIPLLIIFILPSIIGVSISMLIRIMPDFGYTILLSALLSVPLSMLKWYNKSFENQESEIKEREMKSAEMTTA
ncbi:MAG: serine hydrolase domain-containing protein [Fulvivirga sp.]|nr:serine hydrolase domain-containing protein [Fulvivirga sp.]